MERALRMGRSWTYQIQAAISAVHCDAPTFTDTAWRQIAILSGELVRFVPGPVVEINRAVALEMYHGPTSGLALLEQLESDLGRDRCWHAARANLFERAGRAGEAVSSLEHVIGPMS